MSRMYVAANNEAKIKEDIVSICIYWTGNYIYATCYAKLRLFPYFTTTVHSVSYILFKKIDLSYVVVYSCVLI